MSRAAYESIVGGGALLPLEECPQSVSRLAVMRGLTNASTPPTIGRGERTSLDERDGLPRSLLQMYDSLVTDLSRIISDLCTTQNVN